MAPHLLQVSEAHAAGLRYLCAVGRVEGLPRLTLEVVKAVLGHPSNLVVTTKSVKGAITMHDVT